MYIPINRIIVNQQAISEEHVDDFVEWLERGKKTKPILVRVATEYEERTVNASVGTNYVLVDGRHRLAAHKVLGKEMIEVMVTL